MVRYKVQASPTPSPVSIHDTLPIQDSGRGRQRCRRIPSIVHTALPVMSSPLLTRSPPHPSQLCYPFGAFPQCHRDRRCSRGRGCPGTPFLQSSHSPSHPFRLASHESSLWGSHPAIRLLWCCPIRILPGPQQCHRDPGIAGGSSSIP